MYNGHNLTEDLHFHYHLIQSIPVQIYDKLQHSDIGYIEKYSTHYVKVNDVFYHRKTYKFVSRPGY